MKLNRIELKKIIYDFNSISNRLLQADLSDYLNIISKFNSFIKSSPIIIDYISDCGSCEQDLKKEFEEVSNSYGRCIFSLGDTNQEEVRNIFAMINYIIENGIQIHYEVAAGYTSSNKYQDRIKGFNDRVVMVLIRHIESYLTKLGIDMGLDDKATYSISVHNGQVNIANDNAKIIATNTLGIDTEKLTKLLHSVKNMANGLSKEDIDLLESNLEVIEDEIKKEKPRKGFLRTAVLGLKMLKGSAEFAVAITSLIDFIQPLI